MLISTLIISACWVPIEKETDFYNKDLAVTIQV